MRTSSARFVKSATQASEFPKDRIPEVAFCGRSNSGKSSLLNTLTDSRGLARTSSTPGRTQQINFFLINGETYYVDLPGYGYAKVPKGIREDFGPMIEQYLQNREPLRLAILLVDSRMPPTDSDRTMKKWLDHFGIPNLIVLTKCDKISRNEQTKALKICAATLETKEIIAFSAVTGLGKDAVLKKIRTAINDTSTQ